MKTGAIFACFFLTCAFLTCTAARAQRAPAFQSETQPVLIDAVVTGKKGEYVRDLTAKDFRIWEDNKEQTVESLSLETASSVRTPSAGVVL